MMSYSEKQKEMLLIVDDDLRLQALLEEYLGEQGYATAAVGDGKSMDRWLEEHHPALIILDLMLPGEDGLSLARRIRNRGNIPIIILSARGEEVDRIIGLEVGADDYLPKPFSPRELLARIRAVLRRGHNMTGEEGSETNTTESEQQAHHSEHLSQFGEFTLNLDAQILLRDGQEVKLTSGEMALLITLVKHPNRVLSREQLMDMINTGEHDPFDRSIDVRITRLRGKIEDNSSTPRFIRTVWGQGYRFTPDASSGQ
ncbi:MAG: response regulator [Gammaproteobacteria bacterium]|nr:response regulator [Gammaproteobacteria bacterium]